MLYRHVQPHNYTHLQHIEEMHIWNIWKQIEESRKITTWNLIVGNSQIKRRYLH
jgi:NAD-dependent DNA ligase